MLSVVPGSVKHEQGYEMTITGDRVFVIANSPEGCFYAVQTLIQIFNQSGSDVPLLRISDWPDFSQRGVMLDISRDRVPTMETLFQLIELLASFKINQLQLYTEHTFAYQNHKKVWEKASPMTGVEILELDGYCRDRFIELVPNQNTFGHMHRWLKHDEYLHLAEAPNGAQTPWNYFNPEPFSISPVLPESIDLVREMLDELLPHFSSNQINVGCDETYDIGRGKSKDLADVIGSDRVYLDFLLKIYNEVKARSKVMQFWGDIIMDHPNLVTELPRDVIALEWGYQADHPFDDHGALFAASGIPFFVCPGTSSWRTIAGRTDNALENLRNAAEHGLNHGAVGYLNTDWGDEGHWQPLPVSYLGFVYGAAVSWGYLKNWDIQVPDALNCFVFQDEANIMGKNVYDLGNIYQQPGIIVPNSSILFNLLQYTVVDIGQYAEETEGYIDGLYGTQLRIDDILLTLGEARMNIPDSKLVIDEITWVANMLKHGCLRGI